MKSGSRRKRIIPLSIFFRNLELYKKVDDELLNAEMPDNIQDVILMGQKVLDKVYTQRDIIKDIQKMKG